MPKSVSCACRPPSASATINTFAGFKSLWSTPTVVIVGDREGAALAGPKAEVREREKDPAQFLGDLVEYALLIGEADDARLRGRRP